ncbi:magnesium and cobalt transporter [Natronocella acetinitrilica]|uniref:Magnesium and cobalt efflux protein CorC n=1 Tax=Natronocella acetinitrilica TaxID=414046 RepID=A0AAE3G3D0_9GAMM|nr:transporter associated domain-containing protein [Natronocella acetinitrilica]MCP1673946.1 magnesium and cobalt transporter [Natronocella acetinitrilica]
MSEDRPTQSDENGRDQRGWFERISQAFSGEPRDRDGLVDMLREAQQRALLDADQLAMIEGALHVSEMQVRDIMIPRSQMVVVRRDAELRELLPPVIESGHSRFPVIGDNRDDVIGILIAKDLLRYFSEDAGKRINMRELMRPALFVPESKRLDVMLKEFRSSRNHLAVVVDEYGGVAGMVTIEDVLEQIVGEIDDEHDIDEDSYILSQREGASIVKALTPIEDFNEHFHTDFSDEEFDTIGGLVAHSFGHLPRRGEQVTVERYRFEVIRADNRRIHLLMVTNVPEEPEMEARDEGRARSARRE